VKKTAVAAAFACLAAFIVAAQGQQGQPEAGATAATANLPVKVGLVDMARVFKDYQKFADQRQGLADELESVRVDAQKIALEAKTIQEELALLKKDSPEFAKREADLARLQTEFETKRKLTNANAARRDAEIFEQTYVDASNVIKLYAEHFKFTMVLRFNSEPLDSDNPQKLANSLNKLVVYHRPQDDITESVIEYLNRQYAKTRVATDAAPRTGAVQPASGTTRQ